MFAVGPEGVTDREALDHMKRIYRQILKVAEAYEIEGGVGYAASLVLPPSGKSLAGLTIHTKGKLAP